MHQRGIKINLCVEVLDAFTNKRLRDKSVKLTVNGHSPVMLKEEKYYIFQMEQTAAIEVYIKSEFYETKSFLFHIGQIREKEVVNLLPDGWLTYMFQTFILTVLLVPGEQMPLEKGQFRKNFFGEPHKSIPVVKNQKRFYLLAEDYQGGNKISCLIPELEPGRCFQIEDKNGKEEFLIIGREKKWDCILASSLQKSYLKGSKISEIYYVKADNDGKAVGIQSINESF